MFFSGLVILDQSQCTCVKDIDFTLSYHKADSIKLKLGNSTSGSYKFVLITLKFRLISICTLYYPKLPSVEVIAICLLLEIQGIESKLHSSVSEHVNIE